MNEGDKLAEILDDPESREIVFALAHSGQPAGPDQLWKVAAGACTDEVVRSVAAHLDSDPVRADIILDENSAGAFGR